MADSDDDRDSPNVSKSKRPIFSNFRAVRRENTFPASLLDLPEDVQLRILSSLPLPEIASIATTCKHFHQLCSDDTKLWFAICHRRWAGKTRVAKWGGGGIPFKRLFRTLIEWENLVGLWRRAGREAPLIRFEWGASFITGSRVSRTSPYRTAGAPVIFMGLSHLGEPVTFFDSGGRFDYVHLSDFLQAAEAGFPDGQLVPVNINFIGERNFLIEGNLNFKNEIWGWRAVLPEMFKNFGSNGRAKKKGKMKHNRWNWVDDEYVKVAHPSPSWDKHAVDISRQCIKKRLLRNLVAANPAL